MVNGEEAERCEEIGKADELEALPRMRMETGELVQDVNLHGSNLTKLIGSLNKLPCVTVRARRSRVRHEGERQGGLRCHILVLWRG